MPSKINLIRENVAFLDVSQSLPAAFYCPEEEISCTVWKFAGNYNNTKTETEWSQRFLLQHERGVRQRDTFF